MSIFPGKKQQEDARGPFLRRLLYNVRYLGRSGVGTVRRRAGMCPWVICLVGFFLSAGGVIPIPSFLLCFSLVARRCWSGPSPPCWRGARHHG